MAVLDILNNLQANGQDPMQLNGNQIGALTTAANNVQAPMPVLSPEMVSGVDAPPQPTATGEDEGALGFLKGLGAGLANVFTNPEALSALNAFGSSMSNDVQGYNQWMNTYTSRLAEKRQSQAEQQQKEQQQRIWEKNQEIAALYDSYTPESVALFRSTGDYSKLVPNQKYTLQQQRANTADVRAQQGQQGLDIRQQGVYVQQQNADTNRMNVEGTQAYRNKQLGLKEQLTGLNGVALGDGETVVDRPGIYTGTDGIRYRVRQTPTGMDVQAVSASEQKDFEESTVENNPEKRQSALDFDTLNSAIDAGNVGSFTGQIVGRSQTARDVGSSVVGDQASRDAKNAADRIQGRMQNQGIGAAREMGASGINTEAEAKRFFQSMPQLDYTSPEALKSSLATIQGYVNSYNAQRQEQKNTNSSRSNTTQPTQQSASSPSAPQPGYVDPDSGYTFVGGDPASQSSWVAPQ